MNFPFLVCLFVCVCLRSFYEFLQQSEMRKRNETRFTIRSQFIKGNLVVWVLLILFASQLTWFCARVFFFAWKILSARVCVLPARTFQKFRRLAANRTIVLFTLHSKPYLSSVRFAPLFVALMHSVVNFYAKSRLFVFLSRVCGRLLRGKKKGTIFSGGACPWPKPATRQQIWLVSIVFCVCLFNYF